MANFKLGANAITAAYLGTQSVCIINNGANTVFDAGCGATFTVTHVIVNNIGGTSAGYTISVTPSSSKTGATGVPYSFSTVVSLNSGYQWLSGVAPTISTPNPLTGNIGSASSSVTTTVGSATVELIPVGVVTASVSVDTSLISGPSAGYTIVGSQSPQNGDSSSVNYSFSLSASLVAGYEWTGGAPTNATASGTLYSSGTVTAQFGGATVQLIQYVATQYLANNVNGPDAGYFLLWDGISNYNATSGSRQITGTYGQLKSFPESTLSVNSPTYTETSALTIVGGGQQYTTFGNAAWGGSTTRSFYTTTSGTVALTPTDVTVTLSYNTSGLTGAANATLSTAGGLTRTGAPGTSYSFSTTITPDSNYSFSGTSPQVLTGTFPSTSQGVTQNLTGTVSRPTLYYVDRSAQPAGCGTFQGSSYWWADPSGSSSGSSEAYDVAPSGTQVYADANYSSYYSTGGTYSITEPNTGADMTQYISSTGTVGTDNSCP